VRTRRLASLDSHASSIDGTHQEMLTHLPDLILRAGVQQVGGESHLALFRRPGHHGERTNAADPT
jgi:hypothetical protein